MLVSYEIINSSYNPAKKPCEEAEDEQDNPENVTPLYCINEHEKPESETKIS
jgi:hypothetical protein